MNNLNILRLPAFSFLDSKLLHFLKSSSIPSGRLWLTPVILAIQEADIRKIEIRGQTGQIVGETLS
jgi:hypothetical protein